MLKYLCRALIGALVLAAVPARAAWPDRPVTLIVPYAAGGITDVVARVTAERLSAAFKQSFVVQNETGAGGIIGTANAAHAKPDGYTLFFGPMAMLSLSPLTTKVNYDPDKDFMPVSVVASAPFVITVNQGFPADHAEGVHRRGEEEARRLHLCIGGRRQHHARVRAAVPEERGPRHDPRAVSRRRPRVHRHVRRQCADDLGERRSS